MILVDLLWEDDGEGGDLYPIESSLPLKVVPRQGEQIDLNAEPGDWHTFYLEEGRFRVKKVIQKIDLEKKGKIRHMVDVWVEPCNSHTKELIQRLKREQQEKYRHGE